ncbi:MAG: hypothetical protein ACTMUB_00160 [cyanobacterium endosymbiont of Rhopalodia musculus]|uniref:hypothetical protein n=1 Tax=cyanobacterium endosymbiont of Epithemia clementina EcSB TaxID=3034674 RepID=UPI0024806D88|nr:hypothetical protein [cyanobacterium endosymbiont of Epithemia clementina EcSB]WGT66706.1 hypothetical protein P3F56_05400 [cyanobacterium endosymbiont of Epithemia clementina EcSB]
MWPQLKLLAWCRKDMGQDIAYREMPVKTVRRCGALPSKQSKKKKPLNVNLRISRQATL